MPHLPLCEPLNQRGLHGTQAAQNLCFSWIVFNSMRTYHKTSTHTRPTKIGPDETLFYRQPTAQFFTTECETDVNAKQTEKSAVLPGRAIESKFYAARE
jgi:hypothetical protein